MSFLQLGAILASVCVCGFIVNTKVTSHTLHDRVPYWLCTLIVHKVVTSLSSHTWVPYWLLYVWGFIAHEGMTSHLHSVCVYVCVCVRVCVCVCLRVCVPLFTGKTN